MELDWKRVGGAIAVLVLLLAVLVVWWRPWGHRRAQPAPSPSVSPSVSVSAAPTYTPAPTEPLTVEPRASFTELVPPTMDQPTALPEPQLSDLDASLDVPEPLFSGVG